MKTRWAPALCLSAAVIWLPAQAQQPASAERIHEVARRGTDVMPFDLQATVHVFTKLQDGGLQRVVARNEADTTQVRLVREHLRDLHGRFLKGDFSGPAHIHGEAMPGLAALRQAGAGRLAIEYRDVPGGAELRYRAADATLVSAVHAWFDAQLTDHGAHAMAGHEHHEHHHHDHHHPSGHGAQPGAAP